MDMRSVVPCVRDCLSVLLDASFSTAADADIDSTPNQPLYGWGDGCLTHSLISAGKADKHKDSTVFNLAISNSFAPEED